LEIEALKTLLTPFAKIVSEHITTVQGNFSEEEKQSLFNKVTSVQDDFFCCIETQNEVGEWRHTFKDSKENTNNTG
jgi:hypothetical protein